MIDSIYDRCEVRNKENCVYTKSSLNNATSKVNIMSMLSRKKSHMINTDSGDCYTGGRGESNVLSYSCKYRVLIHQGLLKAGGLS